MRYRFGDYALDYATRQLLLNDAEVRLSPKAFELLAFLLANRSRAVSKADLQQHLWPTTFVEETNVAGLIAEIRRALDDPASEPTFVRTVYGFGYRFVAAVRDDPGSSSSASTRTKLHLVSDLGETILLDGVNVIGRGEDATVRIDSPGVSRCHARIVVANGRAMLEDAESKNGTYLNGVRITAASPLADGNEIKLGRIVLTFRVATASTPTATLPDRDV